MFDKLFALFFGKKKEPQPTPTFAERMRQQGINREQRFAQPLRTSKSSQASTPFSRQSDDTLSNPLHPLNPIGVNSPAFYDSTPSHSHSSSYDCGSSSSSSYDSGSSSCDSSSSSSGGGGD